MAKSIKLGKVTGVMHKADHANFILGTLPRAPENDID